MIFSIKNGPLINFNTSSGDHFYFLHHQYAEGLVQFSSVGVEVFQSICASLSRNKKVFLFDKEFSWDDFQREMSRSSVHHCAFHHGVLVLLPSLKNRLAATDKSKESFLSDLPLLMSTLKNNI